MPREPRLDLPGLPLHITQRGVNHTAIFVDDNDRRYFLFLLARASRVHALALHAYVLMGNHVHLLLTGSRPGAVSRAMRSIGQCYVQAFNRRYGRSGGLWQGRFKSSLVESDRYLLAVYRYVELNPVRAGLAVRPEEYRWSSVRGNLGLSWDPLLTPHPTFVALAQDRVSRQLAYRRLLDSGVAAPDAAAIRCHLAQQRALGEAPFQQRVAISLHRSVSVRPVGRPPAR